MKKIIVVVLCFLVFLSVYFVLAGNKKDNLSKSPLGVSLDQYEAIIEKYEKKGVKNQTDLLQFSSEIQRWNSISWSSATLEAKQEDMILAQKRLSDLQSRQMKMMKF